MKYIKKFETKIILNDFFKSQGERDINNLVRNLEYNLIKYFGEDSKECVTVYKSIYQTNDYDNLGNTIGEIDIFIFYCTDKGQKTEVLVNEFEELGIDISSGFYAKKVTIDQAKQLLLDLKNKKLYYNILDIEAKKYNL